MAVRPPEPTKSTPAVKLRPAVAWTCPGCGAEGLAALAIEREPERVAAMTTRLLGEQGREALDVDEEVAFYVAPAALCCERCKTWAKPEAP
jgi:hypothetical protein